MATLTKEQVEQKMQLLAEKAKEMKAISDELKNGGIMELSEEELEDVTGGHVVDFLDALDEIGGFFKRVAEGYKQSGKDFKIIFKGIFGKK